MSAILKFGSLAVANTKFSYNCLILGYTLSRVISIVPGVDNTAIVNWSDMGHKGSTTFTLVKSDGEWKINNATVPDGYNTL